MPDSRIPISPIETHILRPPPEWKYRMSLCGPPHTSEFWSLISNSSVVFMRAWSHQLLSSLCRRTFQMLYPENASPIEPTNLGDIAITNLSVISLIRINTAPSDEGTALLSPLESTKEKYVRTDKDRERDRARKKRRAKMLKLSEYLLDMVYVLLKMFAIFFLSKSPWRANSKSKVSHREISSWRRMCRQYRKGIGARLK